MFAAEREESDPADGLSELETAVQACARSAVNTGGDALADTVIELSALFDTLHLTLAELVSTADRHGVHRTDGYTSMTAFLAHRGRMRAGRAKRLVADGRALCEMPETTRRLRDRRLSLDEARPLIAAHDAHPAEFADHETSLCDAVEITQWVRDAKKVVDYWRQAVSSPADDRRRYEHRGLYSTETIDGMVEIFARTDAATGRQILDRINAATPPPDPLDDRSATQRRLDALADLVLNDGSRPIPTLMMAHMSADRLSGSDSGISEIEDVVLPPSTASRLCCDAAISRIVLAADSHPLDIGRTTRTVPDPMRRAVITRDRHCRFPGCRRPSRWCDAHHIVRWSNGGPTSVDNLILLCRHHHTLVHTQFGLEGSGRDPKFTRPDGTPLPNSPP